MNALGWLVLGGFGAWLVTVMVWDHTNARYRAEIERLEDKP